MKGVVTRVAIPLIAAAGIVYAVAFSTLSAAREPPPPPNQLAMPAESGFAATVAGSGLIEANTRNIAVGSFLSGIVAEVPVVEGQEVAVGEPLFILDRREAAAELAVAGAPAPRSASSPRPMSSRPRPSWPTASTSCNGARNSSPASS